MNPYLVPLLVCCSATGAVIALIVGLIFKIAEWMYRRLRK